MKERPILFSTAMVQAILAGLKTQTRRVVNPEPEGNVHSPWCHHQTNIWQWKTGKANVNYKEDKRACPYGKPGEILWVRETWAKQPEYPHEIPLFKSTLSSDGDELRKALKVEWKPSIHMRKEYAQIWLELTDVRVQRLQDLSEEDAKAEGIKEFNWEFYTGYECFKCLSTGHDPGRDDIHICNDGVYDSAIDSFHTLWDSINAKPKKGKEPVPWASNPWVWALTFKVLSTTGKPANL